MHGGVLTEEMLCAEYSAVYHFVLMLCRGNADNAADLVQETFLRALSRRKTFSGASSLYTWLCAIARNIWLGDIARGKREMPVEDVNEYSKEADVQSDTQLYEIYDILEEIREPYREVFCLRIFGGLPFATIGQMFGKSDSWARVTFFRARKILTERLK